MLPTGLTRDRNQKIYHSSLVGCLWMASVNIGEESQTGHEHNTVGTASEMWTDSNWSSCKPCRYVDNAVRVAAWVQSITPPLHEMMENVRSRKYRFLY